MEATKSSSPLNTLTTFLALYLTTLFSLDTWAAARASPYRAPSNSDTTSYLRPASTPPAPDSYQGGMHGRGNRGPGSSGGGGGSARDVGRVRDNRPPIRMGGSAACGACMI
ncbi:hypothetical protein IQ07DRAFT_675248 [Pyrenochaeta sp. DS3sAY3a]|nr:hypothetical protein IQ07DRAFT_675248 [Pyrenochaeta sp. DS3sAY3a]